MRDIEIILQRNRTILKAVRDEKVLKYSTVATLEDSGEYLCKVEQGRASKTTKLNVVVSGNTSCSSLISPSALIFKLGRTLVLSLTSDASVNSA